MVGRLEKRYLGVQNLKGERKTQENYIKKRVKGLKNAYFLVINSKKIRLLLGKIISKEGGGGNDRNAQYITLVFV